MVGEGLLVLGMHKVKKLWMEIASGPSPLRWMAVRIIRRITIIRIIIRIITRRIIRTIVIISIIRISIRMRIRLKEEEQ